LLQRHESKKKLCSKYIVDKVNLFEESIDNQTHENEAINENINYIKNNLNELKNTCSKIEEEQKNLYSIFENKTNINGKLSCKYCNLTFTRRDNLNKHIKNSCKVRIDNISIYENEIGYTHKETKHLTCRFCNIKFTKQPAFSRHMNKGCRARDEYELELQKTVINRRKEASAQIINGDHATNIIINMPKIEMNPFGQENLDYITTKLLIKELENCKAIQQADVSGIVDRFTKLIHANPAHPENQNVLFKSLNTGFARVYRQNGFQDEQSTEVQDTIIQNVQKLIQTKGCDEYDYNSKTEFADVLEDIDVNYGKLNESLEDGMNTRVLGKCRNMVKAALHSNKEEITSSQNLIQ